MRGFHMRITRVRFSKHVLCNCSDPIYADMFNIGL